MISLLHRLYTRHQHKHYKTMLIWENWHEPQTQESGYGGFAIAPPSQPLTTYLPFDKKVLLYEAERLAIGTQQHTLGVRS